MKSLTSLSVCIILLLYVSAGIILAADIVVDASQAGPGVSQKLFGYNLSYFRAPDNYTTWHHTPAEDLWAWDVTLSSPSWNVRGGANGTLSDIVGSATGTGALIRFPAGDNSDRYYWRRGVGWPVKNASIDGVRPYDVDPCGRLTLLA